MSPAPLPDRSAHDSQAHRPFRFPPADCAEVLCTINETQPTETKLYTRERSTLDVWPTDFTSMSTNDTPRSDRTFAFPRGQRPLVLASFGSLYEDCGIEYNRHDPTYGVNSEQLDRVDFSPVHGLLTSAHIVSKYLLAHDTTTRNNTVVSGSYNQRIGGTETLQPESSASDMAIWYHALRVPQAYTARGHTAILQSQTDASLTVDGIYNMQPTPLDMGPGHTGDAASSPYPLSSAGCGLSAFGLSTAHIPRLPNESTATDTDTNRGNLAANTPSSPGVGPHTAMSHATLAAHRSIIGPQHSRSPLNERSPQSSSSGCSLDKDVVRTPSVADPLRPRDTRTHISQARHCERSLDHTSSGEEGRSARYHCADSGYLSGSAPWDRPYGLSGARMSLGEFRLCVITLRL